MRRMKAFILTIIILSVAAVVTGSIYAADNKVNSSPIKVHPE